MRRETTTICLHNPHSHSNTEHTSNRYGCSMPLLLGKSRFRKCRSRRSEASTPAESRRTCRTTSYSQHGTQMLVVEESAAHLGESTFSNTTAQSARQQFCQKLNQAIVNQLLAARNTMLVRPQSNAKDNTGIRCTYCHRPAKPQSVQA